MQDLAWLFIFGICAVVGVAVLLSFWISARWLRGKVRIAALVGITGAWAAAYEVKIGAPGRQQQAETAWRVNAWHLCKQELAKLPSHFVVEGFLDEGAAIRKGAMQQLFSQRKIRFLDVRVRVEGGQAFFSYPNGSYESGWSIPDAGKPYLRLELSREPDMRCLPSVGEFGWVAKPPFLPDTCLAVTPLAEPSARFVLSLVPAEQHSLGKYGTWRFVERRSGRVLAALTTDNARLASSQGEHLSIPQRPKPVDCRSPHTELVDRIYGGDASGAALATPQVLDAVPVQASVSPFDVQASGPVPGVEAVAEEFWFDADDATALFDPTSVLDAWRIAVDAAREHGMAPFGSQLIDIQGGKLISLSVKPAKSHFPIRVFAVRNGFFVLSDQGSWRERYRSSNLLIRYKQDGTFVWAVRIAVPGAGTRSCARFVPQAVSIERGALVLADRCFALDDELAKASGKTFSGELWRLPLSKLPALE